MGTKKPNSFKIRELRDARGWSQEHLAQVSGLSTRTIQRAETGSAASHDSLLSLAAAFDCEVAELLAGAPDRGHRPPVRLFHRIRSGQELCGLVSGADGYLNDPGPLDDHSEAALVGEFLQDLHDTGEIWDDAEPIHRVRFALQLANTLKDLAEAGFRVYGTVAKRQVHVGAAGNATLSIAVILVRRAGDSRIIDPNGEHERIDGILGIDQPDEALLPWVHKSRS